MAAQYVAAVAIEFEVAPGRHRRIEPGHVIPDELDDDSVAELREHESIVTREKWAEIKAEDERRRESITLTRGQIEDALDEGGEKALREILAGERTATADERAPV